MKCTIKAPFFAIMVLFFSSVFAAKDPISWQLDAPFPASVLTGGTYTLTYTFTNQLPMKLVNPLVIDKIVSPASEFTYVDACTGQHLNPQQSCTVQVTLNSVLVGQKNLQLVIAGYDKNRVPLPLITTSLAAAPAANIQALVTDALPATLAVATTANYAFSFTNIGQETATSVSIQASNPGSATTCTNQLAVGQSCTVSGSYTPQSNVPTVQTVSATFSYAEGSPVTASTSTSVPATPLSGVVGTLVPPNYLPPVMVGGPTNTKTLQFLFTNYNATPVVINSRAVSAPGATFTIGTNPGDDSCNNSPTLPHGAACQILGTYEVPTEVSPTPFTATASVNYSDVGGGNPGSASVPTSTTVVSSLSTNRVVTFVNKCNFPVWFSLNGGAIAGSPSCASDSDCPTGTACNVKSHLCYWLNYAPTNNNYELAALVGTNTVTIPLTSASPTVQWSGNFSASTLCDGTTSCMQASCENNGGSTSCAVGEGFLQPATQAEITMLISDADSYDVEVINGFHLPIKMEPGPYVTPDNYSCGVPGNEMATNNFGACSWSSATVPSTAYYWVTSGGGACGSGCSAGNLCGLDSALNQVCGAFLGYWTANQACSIDADKANPYFGCNNPLTTPFSSGKLKQLMACSVPTGASSPPFNSCYLDYPGYNAASISQCCGCVDWWQQGIGANPNAQSCTKPGKTTPQTDPVWLNSILPTIKWMKSTCPSLYTYTFDDATSGFGCSNNLPQSPNSVGYTITFCAGDTGLPTAGSITDGRIP